MEDRFASAYRPAELMERLRKGATLDAFLPDYEGPAPVSVTLNGASLTLKKLRNYRDSLAPVFHGMVLENENGSVVIGHFSPHPFLFVALLLSLAVSGFALLPPSADRQSHPVLLVVPISFLFSAAAIAVSRWVGRNEKTLLTGYLEACCIEPVSAAAPKAQAKEEAKETTTQAQAQ